MGHKTRGCKTAEKSYVSEFLGGKSMVLLKGSWILGRSNRCITVVAFKQFVRRQCV